MVCVWVYFQLIYTDRTLQFRVPFFHLHTFRKRNSIKRVGDAVAELYRGRTRRVEEREKLISSYVAEKKKFKGNGADYRDLTSDFHAFVSGVCNFFLHFSLSLSYMFSCS